MILGSFRCHVEVILESFWRHVGVILGSFLGLGASWGPKRHPRGHRVEKPWILGGYSLGKFRTRWAHFRSKMLKKSMLEVLFWWLVSIMHFCYKIDGSGIPLRREKQPKPLEGCSKTSFPLIWKKSFRGEVQGSILGGFGSPFWTMLGIIASFFLYFWVLKFSSKNDGLQEGREIPE